MKQILQYSMILLMLVQSVHAQQTNTRNYIISRKFKELGADVNDVSKVTTQIQYIDGLGRTLQNVTVKQNPSGQDFVQPFEYDAYGRQTKEYLPYAAPGNGAYQASALSNVNSWYTSNSAGLQNDGLGRPYTETVYDPTPLNRSAGRRAPGNKSVSSIIKYKVNTADEVGRYDFNTTTNTIVANGSYAAGALSRIQTTDEQGNETNEYTDMLGQLVCKKVAVSSSVSLNTYYVYDDLGQLRAVLQPQYQDFNSLSDVAYVYEYDDKGRLINKKLPGSSNFEIVYDKFFRQSMSRDANQAQRGVWAFTKYDALNRAIMTGEIPSTASRETWQNTLDASTAHHEESTTSGIGYSFTTTQPTSVSEANLLTITYYDVYTFPKAANLAFNSSSAYGPANPANYGLITGGRARMLPGNGTAGDWITSVIYYDSEYRPVQTIKELYDLGTGAIERISFQYKYNLAAVISEQKTEQVLSASITNTHLATYSYDHADRFLSVKEKITNGSNTKELYTLAQRYNALGQLQSKWLHSQNATNYRRRTDITNNMRGWYTDMKTFYIENSGEQPFFTIGLGYANGSNYTNGNISTIQWSGKDQSVFNKGLSFAYDGANRITGTSLPAGASYAYAETETGITYDKNGNIKELTRNGASGVIDNLSYTYIGNRLYELVDASGNNLGVKNGNTAYEYDANGNMLTDGNRGASISYNYLNLPKTVIMGAKTFTYDYNAAGIKHKYQGDGLTVKYAGAFEYQLSGTNNNLYRVGLSEGQAVYRNNSLKYEYYITDHQGNIRVLFDEEGNILQLTDYYPFGLDVARDVPTQTQAIRNDKNRYLFNGKELQVGLGYLDYGARMYMPEIGRWGTVDPLSEVSRRWSPYAYTYNNPIRFIDPDGMLVGDLYDEKGKKIGTDNKDDKRIFVVTDKKTIKELKNTGGVVTDASQVNSAVELPSAFVRAEMGKAVDRSNTANTERTDEFKGDDNEGGFHEEGGVYGTGAQGEDKVVAAKPGSKADSISDGKATIAPSLPASSENNPIAADGSFHVHPAGTRRPAPGTIGGKTGEFNQSPTDPDDYTEAANYPKNSYVLGARSGTVTIYNGSSTKPMATFPLTEFRKIGN